MSKAEAYLAALEKPNFWRLFVDGKKQRLEVAQSIEEKFEVKHGHLAWAAREPEGLHMMRGVAQWLYFGKMIDTPVTLELIHAIHTRAFPLRPNLYFGRNVVDVERYFSDAERSPEQKRWLEGKTKFIQSRCGSVSDPFALSSDGINAIWCGQEIDKYVPILLKNYEEKVRGISDRGCDRVEFITPILNLAQNLELIHMFCDGNLRVVTLILNKELMRFGFDPVILQEPNDLDKATFDEMQLMFKNGQEAYNQFMLNGYPYSDCITESEIAQNITAITKLDLLSRSHEVGGKFAQVGVLYVNECLYDLLCCDLLLTDSTDALLFQNELSQNKNNYRKICALWDNKFLENKESLQLNSELYRAIDANQRLSSQYFKHYLLSKEITLSSSAVDYHEELKCFFTEIGKILLEYKTCHNDSLRYAGFCHLTDEAMNIKRVELQALKVTTEEDVLSIDAATGLNDHAIGTEPDVPYVGAND